MKNRNRTAQNSRVFREDLNANQDSVSGMHAMDRPATKIGSNTKKGRGKVAPRTYTNRGATVEIYVGDGQPSLHFSAKLPLAILHRYSITAREYLPSPMEETSCLLSLYLYSTKLHALPEPKFFQSATVWMRQAHAKGQQRDNGRIPVYGLSGNKGILDLVDRCAAAWLLNLEPKPDALVKELRKRVCRHDCPLSPGEIKYVLQRLPVDHAVVRRTIEFFVRIRGKSRGVYSYDQRMEIEQYLRHGRGNDLANLFQKIERDSQKIERDSQKIEREREARSHLDWVDWEREAHARAWDRFRAVAGYNATGRNANRGPVVNGYNANGRGRSRGPVGNGQRSTGNAKNGQRAATSHADIWQMPGGGEPPNRRGVNGRYVPGA